MDKKSKSNMNILQVNLHFGDNMISACGMLNNNFMTITACNFPRLLRKIKKHIRIENLILTFQPE